MRALLKVGPDEGKIEIRDVELPKMAPDELLLQVKAAAICGSDIGIYDWVESYHHVSLPLIMGHEYAGVVVRVGDMARGIEVGTRVTGLATLGCGNCYSCMIGRSNICLNRRTYGVNMNGAFAEYLSVPARYVLRLPNNISYVEAAPIEALATAAHAVLEQTVIGPGSTVAVLGPGPIGLFTVQLLKLLSVSKIIVMGTQADRRRLQIAQELGADITVDVSAQDSVKSVREETGGRGADFVFEASGNPVALEQAVRMVNRGGTVLMIGIGAEPARIAPVDVVRGAVTLKGVFANTYGTFERVLMLMSAKKLDTTRVITHALPLESAARAFELAKSKKAGKVVLTFK